MNRRKSTPAAFVRIDQRLLDLGLAEDLHQAQALILSGRVLANEQRLDKPGMRVSLDARIRVKQKGCRYVSRGGLKLEGALRELGIDPTGWVCLDLGASTGGFVDCLLQHGASKVYAFDVGRGQLDWSLQRDPRVVMRDGVNVRFVGAEMLEELPKLVTLDLSFISLLQVLPAVRLLEPDSVLALVKPQFEASREEVEEGGLVRDPDVRSRILERFQSRVEEEGWIVENRVASTVRGQKGNQEYFYLLRPGPHESVQSQS